MYISLLYNVLCNFMKVQISDIISGKDRSKKINYTFEIPQFDFEGDIIKSIGSCEVIGEILHQIVIY